jgi:SAM-dependent methyltransferase
MADADRIDRERAFHDVEVGEKNAREAQHKYYRDLKVIEGYKDAQVGSVEGKTVLDYGCGMGAESRRLLALGAIVHAIDVSPVLVAQLKEKVGDNPRFYGYEMNAEALEFEDGFFDVVVGNGILHHLDLARACGEISRVLKPDGKAIFLEPLGMNPIINLYRKLTPAARTVDEKPFDEQDLELLRTLFPGSTFRYFGGFTLFNQLLSAMRLDTIDAWLRPSLEQLDKVVLNRLGFSQKFAWQVVATMRKT